MKLTSVTSSILNLSAAVLLLAAVGCGGTEDSSSESPETQTPGAADSGQHSGWWCVEHGIPEDECAMCNTKLAAEYQAKGDWCEDHNRPDSLCFVCSPEKAEKYAALYEAKYGQEPPTPTE